jgi:hypothetical protein
MKLISVALGLVLFVALPASAQMYKWVDSDGKVHYSDKPPPSNIKTEILRVPDRGASTPAAKEAKGGPQKDEAKGGSQKDAVKAAPQKDAAKAGPQREAAKAGPKTAAEQEQAFRKRQIDAAKAQEGQQKKQVEASDKAENCKRAKANLANLQLGGRQMRIDDKGERVYLDDQQIAQETAKARQDAAAACN